MLIYACKEGTIPIEKENPLKVIENNNQIRSCSNNTSVFLLDLGKHMRKTMADTYSNHCSLITLNIDCFLITISNIRKLLLKNNLKKRPLNNRNWRRHRLWGYLWEKSSSSFLQVLQIWLNSPEQQIDIYLTFSNVVAECHSPPLLLIGDLKRPSWWEKG